jgi:C1A family cysteine protease
MVDGLQILETQGILPLSEFPYVESECSKKPSQAQIQQANEWGIARWYRVNVQSEVEVKSHISAGFPVVIGMAVDKGFQKLAGSVYSATDAQFIGNHAIVVVGYDDDRQAFRLLNSWGPAWGDHGMAWIAYPVFKKVVREGYAVFDIVRDRRGPAPTPKCEAWGGTPYRVIAVDSNDVLNV